MLTAYLEAAMRSAHYELLPDDGKFYGEIPQCNGVYATAASLEECASNSGKSSKSGCCSGCIAI